MSKEHIVYSKEVKVGNLWCLLGSYSTELVGHIRLVERKFLWWELKPCLEIHIYTPYLKKPYYDGEYTTNRVLGAAEIRLRAILEKEKDRIQRKIDRIWRKSKH